MIIFKQFRFNGRILNLCPVHVVAPILYVWSMQKMKFCH